MIKGHETLAHKLESWLLTVRTYSPASHQSIALYPSRLAGLNVTANEQHASSPIALSYDGLHASSIAVADSSFLQQLGVIVRHALMTDDAFVSAFKAMCATHGSLAYLTKLTTRSFEEQVVAHFEKRSISVWNATMAQWTAGKTGGATTLEGLHALRCYTSNAPPLFAVLSLDARLAACGRGSHPTRAFNATVVEAASALPPCRTIRISVEYQPPERKALHVARGKRGSMARPVS